LPGKYMLNFDTSELPQEEDEYIILGSGIAGLGYILHWRLLAPAVL